MRWPRRVALAGGLALLACGGPPPPSPPSASAPTPTPTGRTADVAAPDPAPLPAAVRAALAPRLRAYGSGWELDRIERAFTITVDERPEAYVLTFTARGASGLWAERTLDKVDGFGGPELALPAGPALTPAQQAEVDAILRATGTVWLSREGAFAPLDVSTGVAGVVGAGALETRWRDGLAVLYVRRGHDPIFVLAIDPARRRVTEAGGRDLPPGDSALVPAEEVVFIDAALRRHGDFGVYGNVTAGLTALLHASALSLGRGPGYYSMVVSPRDGHGHELAFRIDARTGVISGLSAGHLAPVE